MGRNRQKGLPLSRAQRIRVLKAIDYRVLVPPVTRKKWANVLDFLIQVECCSGRNGTHASLATLAARMRETIGVSERTARRASEIAKAASLLGIERRSGRRNLYRILWDRAVALSRLDEEALGTAEPADPAPLDSAPSRGRSRACDDLTSRPPDPGHDVHDPGQRVNDPGQTVTNPGQTGRTHIRNNLLVTYSEPPPPLSLLENSAWAAEEEELLRIGMRAAKAAVRAATAAGCTVADWRPHREHWARHRARWREPLGVLKHRLETLRPGYPADQGWPPGEDPPPSPAERAAAEDLADRKRAAAKQWRGLDQPARQRVLERSGLSSDDAAQLLARNTGKAESCGVRFLAKQLARARAP